jgi:C4-dicarboxylate transporter/malic acid transport protein
MPSTQFPSMSTIIRNFVPGWYASVMGTAVIVIDFFIFRDVLPFADAFQLFFLGLSALMLLAITIPWMLRWLLHFDQVRADLTHSVSAAFFPTMPISLIIWGIALEKAGPQFLEKDTVFPIAQALWLLGTAGIAGFALLILSIQFSKPDLQWENANLGWLIPPVSALIVPVLGGSLAVEYAGTAWGDINMLVSLIFLGIGIVLFIFVMSTVFSRYLFHELPAAHLAPTIWIGIAPTAILTIIAVKIVEPITLFFNASEETAQVLKLLAKVLGVGLWGFAFFWLLLAITITLLHHQRTPLSFAMSWWAFTFPLGAFVVASGVIYQAVGGTAFQVIGVSALVGLLLIWATVSARTIRRMLNGSIFEKH